MSVATSLQLDEIAASHKAGAHPGAGVAGSRPSARSASDARMAWVGVLAVVLTAASVALTLSSDEPGDHVRAAVLHGVIVAIPMGVGLWAVTCSMYQRFGWSLIASGFAWSLATLGESDGAVTYSAGRVAGWSVSLLAVYLMLAFPSGRLVERVDRVLMAAVAAVVLLLYVPTALLVDEYPRQTPWALCRGDCPANAFQIVDQEPGITAAMLVLREIITILLVVAVIGVLVRRTKNASRLRRQTLVPVVLAGSLFLVVLGSFVVARRFAPGSPVVDAAGLVVGLAIPTIAIGFLVGLVRWQLFVATALRRLSAELGVHTDTAALTTTLATTLSDPTLELLVWDAGASRWLDAAGAPLDVEQARRDGYAVTEAHARDGTPAAALVADPALLEEPALLDALMSYALAGLDKQRLELGLRDSQLDLEESPRADRLRRGLRARAHRARPSRRRAATTGRRRHQARDGRRRAAARSRCGCRADAGARHGGPAGPPAEVRELAHGNHPAVLSERGLPHALRDAARQSALPASVDASGVGRHSPAIEDAVYFTCLEAMQNATKHARGATGMTISLEAGDGLRFEVTDDGAGLAPDHREGVGIANMRDRIAAVGGSLTLESRPGRGMRVSGTIPVA